MNSEIEEICRRVIGAMFDGGSRGLLIVAVVWAALKLFRRVNAATRHAAWFVTLLIVAGLPVVEFWDLRRSVAIPVGAEPFEEMAGEAVDFLEPAFVEPEMLGYSRRGEDTAPYLWEVSAPQYVGMILVGGWIALGLVRVAGLVWQLCLLGGITRRALAAPADLKAICGGICREMRLRRDVKLLFSSEISAPMVVGFLNPSVLIPQEIAGEARIEPVLRHELAHVARWDDWANLVQQFVKAIFFFHPGVLLASRRLTAEREIACDDHALAALRAPRDYALFLTEFAGRMKGRDFAAAPAAWSSKSQLKERIVMILDGKRNASPRLDRTRFGAMAAGAFALALVTLAAGPRLAFAETEKGEPKIATTVEGKIEASVDVAPEVVAVISATPVAPARVHTTVPAIATMPVADGPRPARVPRLGGEDLERRMERLERMVESLMGDGKMKDKPSPKGPMGMPKPGPAPMPPDHFKGDFQHNWNLNFDHGKIAKKAAEDAKREIERAHAEVERAKREMERSRKDGEWARERAELERERADKLRDQAERQRGQAEKQVSQDRRSLERERQALEEQRRTIEKRIESIEKQMQKEQQNRNNDSSKQSDSNRDSGPKEKL